MQHLPWARLDDMQVEGWPCVQPRRGAERLCGTGGPACTQDRVRVGRMLPEQQMAAAGKLRPERIPSRPEGLGGLGRRQVFHIIKMRKSEVFPGVKEQKVLGLLEALMGGCWPIKSDERNSRCVYGRARGCFTHASAHTHVCTHMCIHVSIHIQGCTRTYAHTHAHMFT